MQHVFVVDTDRKPCNPVDPGKARILLSQGKAAVLRRFPFTIVLKAVSTETVRPYRLKFDPGSKQTGVALVDEESNTVVFAMEIIHRGRAISKALAARKGIRRSRRSRHARYRKPGLPSTKRQQGWLAPSLKHRVYTVSTWKDRIRRYAPVAHLSQELVRFDMQAMECPEISGAEYQQGTLAGYEIREYLLNKWERKCSYCGAENIPIQIEPYPCQGQRRNQQNQQFGSSLPWLQHQKGNTRCQGFPKEQTGSAGKDREAGKGITQGCCCGQRNQVGLVLLSQRNRYPCRNRIRWTHQVQQGAQQIAKS